MGAPERRRAATATRRLTLLLDSVRACRACDAHLPLGPRPIVQVDATARLLLAGQAPSSRVHETGIPWNDASGVRLRSWLGLDEATFYDARRVAIMPMGYCYPGRGQSGDLPPRGECAELWHERLLAEMPERRLTLLIGQYAQRHFLDDKRMASLTDTVASWRQYAPALFPLPHPSPRNQLWLRRNPWFEQEVLPALRAAVARVLRR